MTTNSSGSCNDRMMLGPMSGVSAPCGKKCRCSATMFTKTVLVVAADSKIGAAVSRLIASRGARLILAVSHIGRGEVLQKSLAINLVNQGFKQTVSKLTVKYYDPTSFQSIRALASALCATESRINVVVFCAHALKPTNHYMSRDLVQTHFQVNCLSDMLLTILLLPILNRGHSRIIQMAASHTISDCPDEGVDFMSINGHKVRHWRECVGQSQLAALTISRELALRFATSDSPVSVYTVELGRSWYEVDRIVSCLSCGLFQPERPSPEENTQLPNTFSGSTTPPPFSPVLGGSGTSRRDLLHTPSANPRMERNKSLSDSVFCYGEESRAKKIDLVAQTTLHCAICSDVRTENGFFYEKCRIKGVPELVMEERFRTALWSFCELACGLVRSSHLETALRSEYRFYETKETSNSEVGTHNNASSLEGGAVREAIYASGESSSHGSNTVPPLAPLWHVENRNEEKDHTFMNV